MTEQQFWIGFGVFALVYCVTAGNLCVFLETCCKNWKTSEFRAGVAVGWGLFVITSPALLLAWLVIRARKKRENAILDELPDEIEKGRQIFDMAKSKDAG